MTDGYELQLETGGEQCDLLNLPRIWTEGGEREREREGGGERERERERQTVFNQLKQKLTTNSPNVNTLNMTITRYTNALNIVLVA